MGMQEDGALLGVGLDGGEGTARQEQGRVPFLDGCASTTLARRRCDPKPVKPRGASKKREGDP
jgi:hypothetical protein